MSSAYGTLAAPPSPNEPFNVLGSIHLAIPSDSVDATVSAPTRNLTVFHARLHTIPSNLLQLLYETFEEELEKGLTYPQEGPIGRDGFEGYFFGKDVFIGQVTDEHGGGTGLEAVDKGQDWLDRVIGAYYVKPNYPGRSSHICNAGFIVLPIHRRKGYAKLLGQSYLHFAPQLGYKASVFNLVYANNVASLKIWDSLRFERVGRIPKCGRLKSGEGGKEELHDAIVIWKSFE